MRANHNQSLKSQLAKEQKTMGVIKLYGVKYSPFSKRVEIALKMKGVEYEFVEEDLRKKSPELVKYNPVHKKIPVLVHDGKPIVESLTILEYIDETWEANPLLPSDPYERAQARFWAKFIDDEFLGQLLPRLKGTLTNQAEETEKVVKEAHELLNFLEKEINGKKFFGGNDVGYVDIAGIVVAYYIPILQEAAGMKVLLTKDKFPALGTWVDHLLACDVFKQSLPDRGSLLALYKAFQTNPPY